MGRAKPATDKTEERVEEQIDAALDNTDADIPSTEETAELDRMTDEELAAAGFQADLVERQRNRGTE